MKNNNLKELRKNRENNDSILDAIENGLHQTLKLIYQFGGYAKDGIGFGNVVPGYPGAMIAVLEPESLEDERMAVFWLKAGKTTSVYKYKDVVSAAKLQSCQCKNPVAQLLDGIGFNEDHFQEELDSQLDLWAARITA